MKIQYLGTGAAEGIPAVWCDCMVCRKVRKTMGRDFRTRSQALIDDRLMVDFPPDAYWHMIKYGLSYHDLKNVIFTHSHQDHFYPEEFNMRSTIYAHGITEPVHVWGNEEILKRLENVPEIMIPQRVDLHKLTEYESVTMDGFCVTPLRANHDPKENCLIFIIEKSGRRMLYGNDTGVWPDETWDFIERNRTHFDLVSMDCTMGSQSESYCGHMGVKDVKNTVARLWEDGLVDHNTKFVVTHFSHNQYIFYDELTRMLEEDHILVAYDGFCLEF